MDNFQKIHVNGVNYLIIDAIQNLRAEDSFIHGNNKLAIFDGNGEARKYIGSYTGDNGKRLSDFFEYQQWDKHRLLTVDAAPTPLFKKIVFSAKLIC